MCVSTVAAAVLRVKKREYRPPPDALLESIIVPQTPCAGAAVHAPIRLLHQGPAGLLVRGQTIPWCASGAASVAVIAASASRTMSASSRGR